MITIRVPGRHRLPLLAALLSVHTFAQTNILTNRYNQQRTAANLSETILTPANVNTNSFGKLGTYSVDGVIYAQPLYVQGLTINGATHNVLFVATMHDVVYAFDADKAGTAPLWKLDFRSGTVQPTPIHIGANPSSDATISDTFGIFGTPVIDLANNRMFFVTHTYESGVEYFRLRNVNILTGQLTASTAITASVPAAGSYAAQTFIPSKYGQRPAVELVNGQVWVAFGSRPPGDYTGPWEGWVMTYNANTLAQSGVFVTSRTNGNSIWQSGSGPAVDANGNVYYLTGNGGTYSAGYDLPESLLQLNGTGNNLKNWYTPDSTVNNDANTENYTFLDNYDLDLSCNGPLLIPGTNLVTFGSKTADVFVLNTADLGQLTPGDTQVVQNFHVGAAITAQFNDADRIVGMAYWQNGTGGTLFVWPGQSSLHAYSLNTAASQFTQSYEGSFNLPGEPAPALAVSANGGSNGILWAPVMNVTSQNNVYGQPGILHAYNAANPAQELWNSNMVAADNMGSLAKFVPAVVVNGKVYVANSAGAANPSAGSVTVYGLKTLASPQTITFGSIAAQAVGAKLSLTATASSGLAVSYSASPSTVCTVSGSTATMVGAGTCTITASQTGSSNYAAATPVSQTFAISAVPGFSISLNPTSLTVAPGKTATTSVTVTSVGGFTNKVSLSLTGLPAGVTASFGTGQAIWKYIGPWNWVNLTPGTAMKALAVIKANNYFGIGTDNNVYRFNGTTWLQVGVTVNSIAAGSDGTVLVTNSTNGSIWQYVSDNYWVNLTPGTAMKALAVIKANNYFGIGTDNNVYRYSGTTWLQVGVAASSIAAGPDGTVLVTNSADGSIWQYVSDNNWVNLTPGTAMKSIAVVSVNNYFGLGTDGNIYFY